MKKNIVVIITIALSTFLYGLRFGSINLGIDVGIKTIQKFQKEKDKEKPQQPTQMRDPRLLWLSEPVEGAAYWGSVAISSDTIYLGTSGIDDNPSGADYTNSVCAINRLNGKIKWKFNIDEDEVVKGAISIAEDSTIYFMTFYMHRYDQPADKKMFLYALNPNGTLKWKKKVSNTQPHFWGQASAALDSDGNIYIHICVSTSPMKNAVVCLNPDGTEKWRYEFDGVDNTIWPTPTVSEDVVYLQTNLKLYAINRHTGTLIWEKDGGGLNTNTSVVVDNIRNKIYVGRDNFLFAYSLSGEKLWEFNAKANIFAQPVIAEDGTIYVVTSAKNKTDPTKIAGYVWAVDHTNGKEKWMFNIDPWMYDEHDKSWKASDIYSPAAVGKDGTLYFTAEYRYIWAVNPDGTLRDIYDLSKMPSNEDNWPGGQVTYSAIAIDENGILYRPDTARKATKDYCCVFAIQTQSYGLANSPWPKGYQNNKNTNSHKTETSQNITINYAQEMRKFVINISSYSKSIKPNFIVVPQNGEGLLSGEGSQEYIKAIDGQAREDLFYGYTGFDIPTPKQETDYIISFLNIAKANGKKILVTDYCSSIDKIDNSYYQNNIRGYISFAANSLELDQIPPYPPQPFNVNQQDITDLSKAKNFLYLINPHLFSTKQQFLNALRQTNYDLIIIDLFFNEQQLTYNDIQSLKTKKDGGSRLILSYMSIGEAEDYRYYWKPEWKTNPPEWLEEENPNWPGNYKVRYWYKSWQEIFYGREDSYVKKIIDSGFDGVYLDIIDAYEYFEEKYGK